MSQTAFQRSIDDIITDMKPPYINAKILIRQTCYNYGVITSHNVVYKL